MRRKSHVLSMFLLCCLSLSLWSSCGRDVIWPRVKSIVAMQGETELSSTTAMYGKDTTIKEALPKDANLVIVFSETIDFSNAKSKIFLKDTSGQSVDIELTQALDKVTVKPTSGSFEAGKNLVLTIETGIQDTSGNKSKSAVKVNFLIQP